MKFSRGNRNSHFSYKGKWTFLLKVFNFLLVTIEYEFIELCTKCKQKDVKFLFELSGCLVHRLYMSSNMRGGFSNEKRS